MPNTEIKKMNHEVKTKWLEALRSGEFTQGTGCMRSPDGTSHCCLGVLSELYARETNTKLEDLYSWEYEPDAEELQEDALARGDLGQTTELHPDVAAWAGLPVLVEVKYMGRYQEEEYDWNIGEINDEYEKFDGIVDLIDGQL